MKKVVSFVVAIALLISTSLSVSAAQTYAQVAEEAANVCYGLELIVGSGQGLTPEYLASAPKRYGGAKLIVALRGFLDEAQVYPFTDNFNDYLDLAWTGGQHILGYLKEHPAIGYNGKPGNIFDPNANMSVKEYYKLMLVSLGYVENADFSWGGSETMPDVMTMARQAGLTWLNETDDFTMEKMCIATLEALKAPMKDTTTTLASVLVNQGAIDAGVCFDYGLIDQMPDPSVVAVDDVTVTLSGAMLNESDMIAGAVELDVIILGTKFVESVGDNNAITEALIAGFEGSDLSAGGFNQTVKPNLTHTQVVRVDDNTLTVLLPATPAYDIESNETLTLTLDASVFTQPVTNTVVGSVVISEDSDAPVAGGLTVTIANEMESDLVAGQTELTIGLSGLTWKPEVGSNHESTTALIDNIVGSLSGVGSFNDAVTITYDQVTRSTATEVVVAIPASAGFAIEGNETITITITDAVVAETLAANLDDTVTILNDLAPAVASVVLDVTGSHLSESDVVAGNAVLTLTLTDGSFIADLGDDNADTQTLLAGISGPSVGAGSFNDEVTLTHSQVTRTSDSVMTIAIPATAAYSISATDVWTVRVEASLINEDIGDALTDTVNITKDPQSASVTSLNMTEFGLRSGDAEFTVTLSEGSFADTLGGDNGVTTAFIEGIYHSADGGLVIANGFDASVNLTWKQVTRVSDTEVTVKIPATLTYAISSDETITVAMSDAVLGKLTKPGTIGLSSSLNTSFVIADSGAGSVEKPYILTRYKDLDMLRTHSDAYFLLGNDIDCGGASFTPIDSFTGNLDGQGYSLSNMVIENSGGTTAFIVSADGATIEHISLENLSYAGPAFVVAGLIGSGDGSLVLNEVTIKDLEGVNNLVFGSILAVVNADADVTLSGCSVSGISIPASASAGGLIGWINDPAMVVITDATATVNIVGTANVGGLVGYMDAADVTIRNSNTYGTLGSGVHMGGILGYANGGTISIVDCYSKISQYTAPDEAYAIHRILGDGTGSVQLVDNFGYKYAVLNEGGADVAAWVSSGTGLDGEDKFSLLDQIKPPSLDLQVIPDASDLEFDGTAPDYIDATDLLKDPITPIDPVNPIYVDPNLLKINP